MPDPDADQILPEGAIVIRGDLMDRRVLMDNALIEHDKSGRWALSVGASARLDAAAIASEWPYRGKHYCPSTAGQIRAAGFDLVPDPPGSVHWLLMLNEEPVEETWERLKTCFGPPRDNPSYRGRR